MAEGAVIERTLRSVSENGMTLLTAVATPIEAGRRLHLFFSADTNGDYLTAQGDAEIEELRSIGGAPVAICRTGTTDGPVTFLFAGKPVAVTPVAAETRAFSGLNCFAATKNGEHPDHVLDWLAYHEAHHGLQGAVILLRTEPGSDPRTAKKIRNGMRQRKIGVKVLLLDADMPLGQPDLPSESHPFCTPDAPGKDRMQVPEPDPWRAPLAQLHIYEIMRHHFLGAARAVANVDVYDVLTEGENTIFDAAVASGTGALRLVGRHVYPWRGRKGQLLSFGDNLCVQFDARALRQRWCIAPDVAPADAVWRLVRIGNVNFPPEPLRLFYRCMALRHHAGSVSKLVPKSSLIEDDSLMNFMALRFEADPVRMPEVKPDNVTDGRGRVCIVTTMKNEGPFILEWIAYHRAIGVDDFLVYTNDCTDCTDTLLHCLQEKGIVQHRENPFEGTGLKPQHAALQAAEEEPIIQDAKWVVCMDVDEYINIKTGDGTLDALFAAVPDANMIAMTWRLFGNGDVHGFEDRPIIEQFTRCAPELARKPHQAWGFKTLFQNIGLFKKLGVHRPKGLNPQLWEQINWVNGSGKLLPRDIYRNAWRSTTATYGYDLVQLNHYAVRSAESFLVKRDRGRVNHVDRDQGLAYWFRMNNNFAEETSITRMLPTLRAEMARLLAEPDIAALHAEAVRRHRTKIDDLRATEKFSIFYEEITGDRMQRLSRLHDHFGANVFLTGPDCVPDEIIAKSPEEEFFFTVERGETQH